MDELEVFAREGKFDLIGITETWWDDPHDYNVQKGQTNLKQCDSDFLSCLGTNLHFF